MYEYTSKQKFHGLLDSDEVSFIHIWVYNSVKEKPKLKNQSAFHQSVKGDSVDVDGCASLKYENDREKQEHEFFVIPKMNRNVLLV